MASTGEGNGVYVVVALAFGCPLGKEGCDIAVDGGAGGIVVDEKLSIDAARKSKPPWR